MQTTPSATTRVESFAAGEEGTPSSLKAFGGGFIFLWLGMLALVYVARRRQLSLKAQLTQIEATLQRRAGS
jgi:hypothetical protein